ncbi:MAG: hypothetical protein A3H02_01610 [Candidatus Niyogibacteria bacterium RIFCSPLOWO2_12_FULL_41_13]|uniref:Archease domain-containing protein n=1 Tax=Candidatus Niyogibacteria bacterium RIFCSPLOWO2_12_FULL_41_13 TaxID=1801726 RepID=A0A1G2F171_9BACT|nr:MAG: hypothetical protein A3H02_01610 [Candidatus Niyogibacteria bacterium RIFCSPLOWO2_12_FULL_41_13]
MAYQVLGHIADLRLKVLAKNKEELFKQALKGMAEVLKEKLPEKEKILKEIAVDSADQTSLLVDFLNEVLYDAYANKAVFQAVEFEVFEKNKLKGKIFGYKVKKGFDKDIKAVTYHGAEIKKTDGNFEVILIFDI